jgi:hypothetical protein
MIDVFSNPELIRNARSQLRWGRMLAAAAICVVLSVTIGFMFAYGVGKNQPASEWGMKYLQTFFVIQGVVLVIGGALMCLNAVHREKEMNTFDFQRVTRLTPLELGLGKLFGAPIMAYFVAACFLPAAMFGAVTGRARPSFVIAAYAVLLLGGIVMHSMALMFSIFVPKGTNPSALMLLMLFVLPSFIIPSGESREFFDIASTSPLVAVSLLDETRWDVATKTGVKTGAVTSASPMTDVFFGQPAHHVPVVMLIYVTFIAWFLLAVTRTIKRDPTVYEIYSPPQMLGLLLYVNFLLIGFFRWKREPGTYFGGASSPLEIQSLFLGFNFTLLVVMGFALMRNRDQVRRRLRELGAAASNFAAALWPATYVVAGVLLIGLAVIGMIQMHAASGQAWGVDFAIFRVVFFAAWLARDLLFLQWMNLTRSKRPLVMGVLYLLVFYTCISILFGTFDLFDTPKHTVWTGIALPITLFTTNLNNWTDHQASWMMVLVTMLAQVGLFTFLHRRKLLELTPQAHPAPLPPSAPAAPEPASTGSVLGLGS